MKYVINMKTWLRGEGEEESFLLRPTDEKMCCMGMVLEQAGVPHDALEGVRTPTGVPDCRELISLMDQKLGAALIEGGYVEDSDSYDSILSCRAMTINDSIHTSDQEKIQKLTELFATHDIELEFV